MLFEYSTGPCTSPPSSGAGAILPAQEARDPIKTSSKPQALYKNLLHLCGLQISQPQRLAKAAKVAGDLRHFAIRAQQRIKFKRPCLDEKFNAYKIQVHPSSELWGFLSCKQLNPMYSQFAWFPHTYPVSFFAFKWRWSHKGLPRWPEISGREMRRTGIINSRPGPGWIQNLAFWPKHVWLTRIHFGTYIKDPYCKCWECRIANWHLRLKIWVNKHGLDLLLHPTRLQVQYW